MEDGNNKKLISSILLFTVAAVSFFLIGELASISLAVISALIFLLIAINQENKTHSYFVLGAGFIISITCFIYNKLGTNAYLVISLSHLCSLGAYYFFLSRFRISAKNLQYKNELLKEVYDKSPEAVLLLDYYSRKIVDCNDRAIELFEYKDKSSIVGQPREKLIINPLSEKELKECKKQISLTGSWTKTVNHKTFSGRQFWAKITTSPLQVKKKKYYVSRILDVTDKIAANENLEHTNEQLNRVLNTIDSVVYSAKSDGIKVTEIEYVSDRIKNIYGLSKEEYISKFKQPGAILDLIHPDDQEALIEANKMLLKHKKEVTLQYRFKNPKKGKYVWIEEKVFPQFNEAGEHIGSFGIGSDITIRKEYENTLKESEERYRTLFERNLAGVYKANVEDKVILDCNDAFANILGYKTKHDVLNKVSSKLYESSSDKGQFHEEILKKKSVLNHESKIKLKSGEEIWILENSRVVEEHGKPSYVEGTLIDITPLKQTQEALKESQENLSLVINSLDDIIYNIEVNQSGKNEFKYVSPQIEKVIGIDVQTYQELAQTNGLSEFIHEDDIDGVIAMIAILKEKKKPMSLVYRFKNQRTQNYHWLEENIYPKVVNNEIAARFGIIRDITQRKFAEEALRISEKRYRGLFERNMAGVFRISMKGEILEHNQAFANILGYNETELKQIGAREIYYSNTDRQAFLDALEKNQFLNNYEIRLKTKEGLEVWCLVNSNYNKEWQLVEGTLIDISELKQTGEALIESEEALSSLMDKLPGMAYRCFIDDNWTMEYISDGCFELTGYHPDQIIGNNKISYNEIIHPDFRGGTDIITKEALSEKRKRFVFEYKIIDKSGEEKWVWEQGQVVLNEEGEPTKLEGFITDITLRKKNEEQLSERNLEYQSMLDMSPYAIILHKDGEINYINKNGYELLEIDIQDKIKPYKEAINELNIDKRNIKNYILPKYHKAFDGLLNEDSNDKTTLEAEMTTLRERKLDIEIRSSQASFEGQDMSQAVIIDITSKKQLLKEQARAEAAEQQNIELEKEINKHKQTQKRLAESQRYTKNLIESSLDIILGTDTDFKINEVNQSGLEKFGYTYDELIGKDPSILYKNAEDYIRVKNELDEHGKFIGEIENVDKYGKVFSSILSSSLIKNEEGEVIGAMGISRDITEIKDVEKIVSKQSSTIKSIFESNSNMLIWIVDTKLNYVSFNSSFLNASKLLLGEEPKNNHNLIKTVENHLNEEEYNYFMSYFNRALKGANEQFEVKLSDRRGNPFWLELYLCPIILEDGTIKEIACLGHEITDKKFTEEKIKESLFEKEVLLKEVHHRVKNNLQVISSILNLQTSYVTDTNTLNILRESQNRIRSMSFIHESLYQTKNFSSINFSEYIINLAKNLIYTYQVNTSQIDQLYEVEQIDLELDQAIPCGLIVNELVSNALKYAFPNDATGEIVIGLKQVENSIELRVEDNGIGLPDGFDPDLTNTLGLQLVVTLIDQIDGKMEINSDSGTKYLITFERQTQKTHG